MERLEKLKESNENILYDINYTFVDQKRINILLKKNQLVSKRKKIEFEKNNTENIGEYKLKELEVIIEDFKFDEEKLLNEFKKSQKNFEKIDDIYVTFKTTEEPYIFQNAYKRGIMSRCCTIFCCNRKSIEHL